jgi:hypothetical protein
VADWAATAQEGVWELVESAWVVVEFLALVRFRVMSSEVETSLAANLQYYSERGHKNREIDSFVSRRRYPPGVTVYVARSTRSIPHLRLGMTNYCSHLS